MEYEKYQNTKPYPAYPEEPKLKDATSPAAHRKYADALEKFQIACKAIDKERDAYHNETRRLNEQFKTDLFAELRITGHPKAERLYGIAYEESHSGGFSDVYNTASSLVDLLMYTPAEIQDLDKWDRPEEVY